MTAPEVPRDRDPADYPAEVATWQAARADAYAAMIEAELPPGGVGAFLVWGDPALYDGTLRLLHGVAQISTSSRSPASAACRRWPRRTG